MSPSISLWDDNPSIVDLLGFDAIAAPVIGALESPDLDPITVGIHGPWGGGKSTILGLLQGRLDERADLIVVRTDPWEYDDHADVKGTLIAEVLGALEERFKTDANFKKKTKALLERISWSRVALTLGKGILGLPPDIKELAAALTPKPKESPESMSGFRDAFAEVLRDLPDIKRVVVLVDDLDRCLPKAVMATLEAIKLFLSVPKMAFVIAADQDMVRDAIAASLASSNRGEGFAVRYLEKIVQLPVYLPRLAAHEAEAYVGLLLARTACESPEHFDALVVHCRARRAANEWPLLSEFDALPWHPGEETLALASQLSQGLGSDRVGNPRQIKRFLNAFGVRQHIAEARNLNVSPAVIAKLLLLEDRYRSDFDALAVTPEADRAELLKGWERWATGEESDPPAGINESTRQWAASEPSLAEEDLGPYITLAATLVASTLGGMMSDQLAALVLRFTGPSEADRENAFEEAAKRPLADQQQLVSGLISRTRHVKEIGKISIALVALAKRTPALEESVASAIRDHCFKRLDEAAAYELAASSVPSLVSIARDLVTADGIEAGVVEAARAALEEGAK